MCEYCQYDENGDTKDMSKSEQVIWEYGLLDVGVFIDKEFLHILVLNEEKEFDIKNAHIPEIKINYCPICGRNLTETED